jgi:hypothetical protein
VGCALALRGGGLGSTSHRQRCAKVDVFELIDVFCGLFIGIVQLEDIRSKDRGISKFLKPTLLLAQRIIIDAIALSNGKKV